MRAVMALLCGLLFGAGLSVSGMINPAKVLNFLDIGGAWDPSLAFVMAGAVAVTFVGYKLVFGLGRPVFEPKFTLPTRTDVDARLLLGAAVFGIGWGLGGYCPGPALAGLALGTPQTLVFIATLGVGLVFGRWTAEAKEREKS